MKNDCNGELDAYDARIHGLTRDELHYILDPKDVYDEDFPGKTSCMLKEKKMKPSWRAPELRQGRAVILLMGSGRIGK
jgi:hypothetical protein